MEGEHDIRALRYNDHAYDLGIGLAGLMFILEGLLAPEGSLRS